MSAHNVCYRCNVPRRRVKYAHAHTHTMLSCFKPNTFFSTVLFFVSVLHTSSNILHPVSLRYGLGTSCSGCVLNMLLQRIFHNKRSMKLWRNCRVHSFFGKCGGGTTFLLEDIEHVNTDVNTVIAGFCHFSSSIQKIFTNTNINLREWSLCRTSTSRITGEGFTQ